MNTVYLLLGSNLENPLVQLADARASIAEDIGPIIHISSIYKTAAWGKQEQPDFYNQVIVTESSLSPEECMQQALSIEKKMGRIRSEKYGPRIIDIDILLYGDLQMATDLLEIPHPQMCNRRFTLVPLNEVAPLLQHPVHRSSIQELLAKCPDPLPVDKI